MSKLTSCFELAIDHFGLFATPFLKFLHVPLLAKIVAMNSKGICKMIKVVIRNFEQFERK